MKKRFVAAFAALTILTVPGLAQQTVTSIPLASSDQMLSAHSNRIHVKAIRDFLKRNKTVCDAQWLVVENGYEVKYTEGNRQCRTVYNSRGTFCYTVKQYSENQMPRDVRAQVKSRYYDYSITLIEELVQPFKPVVYIIHMQDGATWKNLQVCDGEIAIMSDYIKG